MKADEIDLVSPAHVRELSDLIYAIVAGDKVHAAALCTLTAATMAAFAGVDRETFMRCALRSFHAARVAHLLRRCGVDQPPT